MRATSLYDVFFTLFTTAMFIDATTLTTPSKFAKKNLGESMNPLNIMQENAKSINDMIFGQINQVRLKTTKSTLLRNNGGYFHQMLGLDNRSYYLPNEIGKLVVILNLIMNFADIGVEVLDYFQPEQTPSWDPKFCGEGLRLHDNNRSVTSVIYGYQGVQSAQPISRYSVQVVKGRYIMIGFAPRIAFQKNRKNFDTCGYFVWVNNGRLYAQGDIMGQGYGTAIPEESIVTAIHDSNERNIKFQVNGKNLGIAFDNVPYDELYAAADIWEGAEIRIIENESLR